MTKKDIPYGRQWIDDDDIAAVNAVLKSDFITQGPKVHEFERALCTLTGAAYAVAVNSGTSALHIACIAAGVEPGDEGITSTNSFVASANCIVYEKGTPVLTDIDSKTFNMSLEDLAKKMSSKTKVVIPVHFAGLSCDMDELSGLVKTAEKKHKKRIFIIEDASHALGSTYKGAQVGSCRYSDMVVFSFHPVKHITTGEGGAVLTNDKDLYQTLLKARNHGIVYDTNEFSYTGPEKNRPGYFEQSHLGYNYRITDIQCALGVSQLQKLPDFIRKRKKLFDKYQSGFQGLTDVQCPHDAPGRETNFHLFVLRMNFQNHKIHRNDFMNKLKEKHISTQVHYIPIHSHPYYKSNFHTKWGDYPEAERFYQQCLSIPFYPALSGDEADTIIDTIRKEWS